MYAEIYQWAKEAEWEEKIFSHISFYAQIASSANFRVSLSFVEGYGDTDDKEICKNNENNVEEKCCMRGIFDVMPYVKEMFKGMLNTSYEMIGHGRDNF